MAYFQITRGDNSDWRYRFRGDNHEIVASGEGYSSLQACEHAIGLIKREAAAAPVVYPRVGGLFGGRRLRPMTNALMTKS